MSNYMMDNFKKHCLDKVDDYHKEYGTKYLANLIFKNTGKNYARDFSEAELEFINSSFVSAYIKRLMIKCLNNDPTVEKNCAAKKILLSAKTFNQMNVEEITNIVCDLGGYAGYHGVPALYKRYFFTIKGKGVKQYLRTQVNKLEIAEEFLFSSGMSTRAEYYSGRGVLTCDLGPDHLESIYKKFEELYPKWAVEFYKMVISMPTLGATEFIDTLYRFARNGFTTKGLTNANNNVISDSATHTGMALGFIAALGNRQSEDDQIRLSNNMKYVFFNRILGSLQKLDPELWEKHLKAARQCEIENYHFYSDYLKNNENRTR